MEISPLEVSGENTLDKTETKTLAGRPEETHIGRTGLRTFPKLCPTAFMRGTLQNLDPSHHGGQANLIQPIIQL